MLKYIVDICNCMFDLGGIALKKYILLVLSSILLVVAGIMGYSYLKKETMEMSYPSFLEAIDQGRVEKVIMQEAKNTFQAVLKEIGRASCRERV